MTIDNHSDGDNRFDACPLSHAETHSRAALEQSALFAARLAIARWSNASAHGAPAPRMPQADWLARSQQDFQQWLARGGFAQYGDEYTNLKMPTMYAIGATGTQPV